MNRLLTRLYPPASLRVVAGLERGLGFLREPPADAYEAHITLELPIEPAARWEYLLDLYAPKILDEDGEWTGERDPAAGCISTAKFKELFEVVDTLK